LIFADASELSSNSRLVDIPGVRKSTTLEALSGADLLITPLSIPPNSTKLLNIHAKAGALFVQRKSGEDLVRSIGERINSSLARMVALNTRQFQRILLSTGFYAPRFDDRNTIWVGTLKSDAKGGKPFIWWKEIKWSYFALQTELRHFAYRGGVYIPLSCDDEVAAWCKRAEEEITAFHNGETSVIHQVWPTAKSYPPDPPLANDPLQEPIAVTDSRVIIAQIKGIGSMIANRVWAAIIQNKKERFPDGPEYLWEPDFVEALEYLTTEPGNMLFPIKIKGLGKGKRAKVRDSLGIPGGTVLDFRVVDVYELAKWETEWGSVIKDKAARGIAVNNTDKGR